MDKINIGSEPNTDTGDTLRAGGQKINENFKQLVAAVNGGSLWDAATSEEISLAYLQTQNKTHIVAAINEVLSKTLIIDDSLSDSLLKTWSINKLQSSFADKLDTYTKTEVDDSITLAVNNAVATLLDNPDADINSIS